jgi:hypothetical protein
MRVAVLVASISLACAASASGQEGDRIGHVDLFGTRGANVAAVASALRAIEGNRAPSSDADHSALLERVAIIVKDQTGRPATDIAMVCCDERGAWTIYVGLAAEGMAPVRYAPVPHGSDTLPQNVQRAHDDVMQALEEAVRQGASEDHKEGYALSSNPALRRAQLALRDAAVASEKSLYRVLAAANDPAQRAAAAYALGYAPASKRQIAALIAASRDADDGTRNNAVRSLWAIADSTQPIARDIPFDPFISLLTSGRWSDRNKGLLLVGALSERRSRALLDRVRREAQFELIEMARWRVRGHSDSARLLLGRIAGLTDARIAQLIDAGDVDAIVAAVNVKRP